MATTTDTSDPADELMAEDDPNLDQTDQETPEEHLAKMKMALLANEAMKRVEAEALQTQWQQPAPAPAPASALNLAVAWAYRNASTDTSAANQPDVHGAECRRPRSHAPAVLRQCAHGHQRQPGTAANHTAWC